MSAVSLKIAIKRLRSSQPFNAIVTSASRSALALVGGSRDFVVSHLPRVGLVETALPNGAMLRLWSEGDDGVSNQMFWRGWDAHEPEVARLFYPLALESRVTLDVGAFIGTYSLVAA